MVEVNSHIITYQIHYIIINIFRLDEVSALVASAGNTTLAAGYAGEDTPKSIVNTSYGQVNDKLYFGDEGPDVFRPSLEVHDIMSDRLGERIRLYIVTYSFM